MTGSKLSERIAEEIDKSITCILLLYYNKDTSPVGATNIYANMFTFCFVCQNCKLFIT